MAQPRIFLSQSSKDIEFTQRLEADLRAAGAIVYRVSADQGGDFQRRIDEALLACEWVVLVLTKDALASTWVQQEIYAANRLRHDGRIREILPIQAGAVDYHAIPPLWGVYNIFDAIRDYPFARDGLLRTLGMDAQPLAVSPAPSVGARPVSPAASPVVAPAPAANPAILPSRLAQLGFAVQRNVSVDYIVPPLVTVPAGEFVMGSDPKQDNGAYDDEKPQHRQNLLAFQIGKFPLTVAEYACFVRSGHAEPRPWEQRGNMVDWQAQLEQLDHPVVMLSWHDAVAYAAWLAKQAGETWRLPTEAEWEKAARGIDGRIYPWGDSFDNVRCNTNGYKDKTTPVNSYVTGAGPYGVQDIAGNVLEWTSSLFRPYPYSPDDGRENVGSAGNRVLRGGSWLSAYSYARAASRVNDPPDYASLTGARLARVVTNL